MYLWVFFYSSLFCSISWFIVYFYSPALLLLINYQLVHNEDKKRQLRWIRYHGAISGIGVDGMDGWSPGVGKYRAPYRANTYFVTLRILTGQKYHISVWLCWSNSTEFSKLSPELCQRPPLWIALINSSRDLAKFSTEPQALGAASINYQPEQNASEEQKMQKKCKICGETKNHPCCMHWSLISSQKWYLSQASSAALM